MAKKKLRGDTESEATHTPTPWMVEKAPSWNLLEKRNSYTLKVTADGLTVAMMGMDQEANAAFIVRAVNAHEEYERIILALKPWAEQGRMPSASTLMPDGNDTYEQAIKRAIAKAEGK